MYKKRIAAIMLSIFAFGVAFGILLRNHDTLYFRAIFMVLAAISVLFCLFTMRIERTKALKYISATALAVAAFSFGVIRVSISNNAFELSEKYSGESDIASFKIIDVNQTSVDARLLQSEKGVAKGEVVRLYLDDNSYDLVAGDIIEAEIEYYYEDTVTNLSSNVSLEGYGDILSKTDGTGIFYKLRKSVSDSCDELYDNQDSKSISKAITIGDRSELNSYLYSVYNNAGLSHLLAISGLHISIIAMGIHNALLSLSVHRKICSAVGALTAVIYMILVGFTPSIIRAAFMVVFVLLFRIFLYNADNFTALFIALGILIIANPYSLASSGLQLSFLSCLGIMLSGPIISKTITRFAMYRKKLNVFTRALSRIITAAVSASAVSLVAAVFTFPVLYVSFDSVSYISPLTNIVAVPIFSLALKLCFLSYIFYPIIPSVGIVFAKPAAFLLGLVTDMNEFIYSKEIGCISLNSLYTLLPFACAIAMIISLVFLERKKRFAFFTSAALFCVSVAFCGIYNYLSISDKALIEYASAKADYVYIASQNENAYIDFGGLVSENSVVYRNGETTVDKYIITKYDEKTLNRFDHMSGTLYVASIYLPPTYNADEAIILSEIKELANERNCVIIEFDESLTESMGTSELIMLSRGETFADELLVGLDVCGKRVRVLGDRYNSSVVSDIVFVTGEYLSDYRNIKATDVYASVDFIQDNIGSELWFKSFDKSICVEFDISESEYRIYEP